MVADTLLYICSYYLTDLRSSSSIKNNIKLLSIRTILLAYMRLLSFQERDYVELYDYMEDNFI